MSSGNFPEFGEEGISKAFGEVCTEGKEELQQCGNGKTKTVSDIDQRLFVKMESICLCRWIGEVQNKPRC